MPIYCYDCGKHYFEKTLSVSKRKDSLRCEFAGCKRKAEQVFKPTHNACFKKPIVVFRNASGEIAYPGDPTDPAPKGYERQELRTIREVESFEREVGSRERGKAEKFAEAENQFFEVRRKQNRSDLRMAMQSWSPLMRAAAEQAMRKTDERPRKQIDGGVLVHVLHYDNSNRAAREK